MGDHERGQLNTSAAEVYESLFVPALFGRFSKSIADAAGIGPGDAVLDVACGTGALTRAISARTSGRVVGVDLSPAMVAIARANSGEVEFVEGDAMNLGFDDDSFDLATCQFGLMFYPDPARGIAEMIRVAPRGTVAVWDSIERSEGYTAMQELFRDELGADAAASLDAPFAMGRNGVLESILEAGGVGNASVHAVAGTARFASIDEWVTTEVRGWTLGDSVSDERLAELVSVARDRLAGFSSAEGCRFGIAAKVVSWSL